MLSSDCLNVLCKQGPPQGFRTQEEALKSMWKAGKIGERENEWTREILYDCQAALKAHLGLEVINLKEDSHYGSVFVQPCLTAKEQM